MIEEVVAPVRSAPRATEGLRRPAPWTLPLFGAGLVLGIALAVGTAPAARVNPYPSLPTVAEPEASAVVVVALVAEDPRALGRSVDATQLKALGEAIQPIVTVFECKFTGAVERGNKILAAYIVQGRDRSGSDAAVGFVLHVQAAKVVGVN